MNKITYSKALLLAKKVWLFFRHAHFYVLMLELITMSIGYEIHKDWFWTLIDMTFAPFVWIKWVYFGEITHEITKQAFDKLQNDFFDPYFFVCSLIIYAFYYYLFQKKYE